MEFNLKKFLKNLKLNEESISMVLGALVIIIVGILIVNYFKDRNGTTLEEATNTESTSKIGSEHVVKEGESLWSIAEEAYGSGYNWTDIYTANKLTSENVEVGQKLTIPEVTVKELTSASPTATPMVLSSPTPGATLVAVATQTPAATLVPTGTPLAETKGTTNTSYTVVKGDSLWTIAEKEYGSGYKWVEIARANKLVNPDVIHSGNVLTLPR